MQRRKLTVWEIMTKRKRIAHPVQSVKQAPRGSKKRLWTLWLLWELHQKYPKKIMGIETECAKTDRKMQNVSVLGENVTRMHPVYKKITQNNWTNWWTRPERQIKLYQPGQTDPQGMQKRLWWGRNCWSSHPSHHPRCQFEKLSWE